MITEKQTLAVVLNANSEQGMQAVKDLINQYNRVLLVGDKRKELDECVNEIAKTAPDHKAYYVEADLTKEYDLTEFISLVKNKFGGADCLVNCRESEDQTGKSTYDLALEKFQKHAMN